MVSVVSTPVATVIRTTSRSDAANTRKLNAKTEAEPLPINGPALRFVELIVIDGPLAMIRPH